MHFLLIFLGFASQGIEAYVSNVLHPYNSALIKLNNYDSSVRPPGVENPDDPINVTVNIFLRSIDSFDHVTNEFKIQVTLREEWTDTRLAFTGYDKEITTNEVQLFWKPDLFFSNEVEGHWHTITKPNIFVRINSSGKILLSSRISLTLKCPMNLGSFPMDTQTCGIRMPTYGYTVDDVLLQWKDDDAIQYAKTAAVTDFTLVDVAPTDCTSHTNTGSYSCLQAAFVFDRNIFPYIVRIIIPTIVLVMCSWVPFWLPVSSAILRLTVSSVVTFTTMFIMCHEKFDLRIPIFCFLDVWLSGSNVFVYAAFFQFALLTYNNSKAKHVDSDVESQGKDTKVLWVKFTGKVNKTDAKSRLAFPVAYLIFNIFLFAFISIFDV